LLLAVKAGPVVLLTGTGRSVMTRRESRGPVTLYPHAVTPGFRRPGGAPGAVVTPLLLFESLALVEQA
jgi:hypothetical protein